MVNDDISKLKIDRMKISPPSTLRRKKGLFFWILIIALIIGLFFLFKKIFNPTYKLEITKVSQMYPAQAVTILNASGYVVAQRKASVSSKITGRLISISVEEGERVKEGQIIARLENQDALATRDKAEANLNVIYFKLKNAEADLEEATLTLNRNKELIERGLIPQAEYDTSESQYKKAKATVASAKAEIKAYQAALKEIEVNLDYAIIRAPFDGTILTKNADLGDIVTPLGAAAEAKAAVVTIADMNSLQVEVDVSESNLEKIRLDQPCEIQLDAFPSSRFQGLVHMIVPTADRTKATVMVKVKFLEKDPRILPEMSSKVAFLSRSITKDEQSPRTVVSPTAIVIQKDKKVVFLVKDEHVLETPVTLGNQLGEMVEVVNGIKEGDKVVLKPPSKLKNGDKIKIVVGEI
ncbi:MAG: efflux RND transporter periplasmic adaptor subunit [bacterium]